MQVETPVDFGYLEWDGQRFWFKETHEPVPATFQRVSQPEIIHPEDPRWQYTGEVFMPLENGLHCWLFPSRHMPAATWEVVLSLWVPCPQHPKNAEPGLLDECAFPAVPTTDRGVVTHPAHCMAFVCEGCWHGKDGIDADPGDRDEFWQVLRAWSSLRYEQHPELVPDHSP